MTDTATATEHVKRPVVAHSLRIFAVPIVLFWIAVAVCVNVIAPQLEVVGELHSAPMAPEDAPSNAQTTAAVRRQSEMITRHPKTSARWRFR